LSMVLTATTSVILTKMILVIVNQRRKIRFEKSRKAFYLRKRWVFIFMNTSMYM
jgi:hypothetical protein